LANTDPTEASFYSLFRGLNLRIRDEDECATLIGYVILDRLFGLEHSTDPKPSEEESKFRAVKSIRAGLEDICHVCDGGAKELIHPSYFLLCEVKTRVDPQLRAYLERIRLSEADLSKKPTISTEPPSLLGSIAINLSLRGWNYEERLRRNVLRLIDGVYGEGEVRGTKNSLLRDYHAIVRHLG